MSVSRFGVSLDEDLLKALDHFASDNGFANRSQAIRHLIEKNMVEEKWKCDNIVAGAVVLVFNNQKKDILKKSSEIQSEYNDVILSVQGFYLNELNYLEIIAVTGPSKRLTEVSEKLISIKGIQHGKLVMSKAQ
ncbi:MAG: nickel-responsive transcriptional regulator NikR [Prolixibacteraceae bacterium]|jgi:CopG family transcriptional regulator, nickel-responsive regulator|nr:nickel-responsive transcriptional regulator NikR [Prolixibacteraceae bacterium]MBT6006115.1 nickel-responsive transcriptional regulator NikR [Prolixibacteraceae bacterium]MBT6764847.1 nickel-responsive transcriptional regulator NikR [Prolixibacteraceae bacterium]MBT6998121.1 nickel-responsive transcriptional regulator NikR [Prolixibacteraceae bacterium]MBT7393937.1 nickel-responsive transcriptional regulator NikR [Prolixibacteraceae bacterium]